MQQHEVRKIQVVFLIAFVGFPGKCGRFGKDAEDAGRECNEFQVEVVGAWLFGWVGAIPQHNRNLGQVFQQEDKEERVIEIAVVLSKCFFTQLVGLFELIELLTRHDKLH